MNQTLSLLPICHLHREWFWPWHIDCLSP